MRSFVFALIAVAILATTWSFSLNGLQETAGQVPAQSVRLDQQEAVNTYGRES